MGHRAGACVLIDGAQSVPHLRVNMQTLGADFFVFSGHKIFGPTGIGVLYGRQEVLESMPPWEGGGNMIVDVTFEKTSLPEAAGPLRGRHREYRGCRRTWRRAGLCQQARAWKPLPTTSMPCWSTRLRGCAPSRVCG